MNMPKNVKSVETKDGSLVVTTTDGRIFDFDFEIQEYSPPELTITTHGYNNLSYSTDNYNDMQVSTLTLHKPN